MRAVSEVLQGGTPDMLKCYRPEQAFRRKHDAVETVAIRFRLEPSGTVADAAIERSAIREPEVERCILDVLQNLGFPRLPTESGLALSFPLHFRFSGNLVKGPAPVAAHAKKKKQQQKPAKKVAHAKAKSSAKAKSKSKAKNQKQKSVAAKARKSKAVSQKKKPGAPRPKRAPAAEE